MSFEKTRKGAQLESTLVLQLVRPLHTLRVKDVPVFHILPDTFQHEFLHSVRDLISVLSRVSVSVVLETSLHIVCLQQISVAHHVVDGRPISIHHWNPIRHHLGVRHRPNHLDHHLNLHPVKRRLLLQETANLQDSLLLHHILLVATIVEQPRNHRNEALAWCQRKFLDVEDG